MSAEAQEPGDGVVVLVYDDSGYVSIAPDQWEEVRAKLRAYIASGGTRDELLDLELRTGSQYLLRLSKIINVERSTSAERARGWHLNKQDEDEKAHHKADAGYVTGFNE